MGIYVIMGAIAVGIIALILSYFIYSERAKPEVETPANMRWFSRREKEQPKQRHTAVKPAPLSGVCTKCKNNVSMPFKCKFCGKLHCIKHRLPESHSCTNLPLSLEASSNKKL